MMSSQNTNHFRSMEEEDRYREQGISLEPAAGGQNNDDDDDDDEQPLPSSTRRPQKQQKKSPPNKATEDEDDDDDDDDDEEEEEEEDDDEDEDEDDDEDDEEDEEDENRMTGRKRKGSGKTQQSRKRKRGSRAWERYFEGEAVEDEDEDEGADVPAADLEGTDRTEMAYRRIRKEYDERKRSALETKEANEIADYYSQRAREYREGDDRSAYETGAMLDYSTAVPSVNDPKLWMVQCKAGEETRILTALMNKYISKAMADSPLGIFSVVCPASGTLFVEAYNEQKVQDAIHGIQNIYGFRANSIKRIPIDEMTSVLNVERKKKPVKRNQWVRMSRGMFKDDLARVLDVVDGGAKVVVQLLPRIDIGKLSLTKEQRNAQKKKSRPPQRFFNRDEIREGSNNTAQIDSRRGPMNMRCDFWENNYYRNGFLLKLVNRNHIDANAAPPTVEELAKFSSQAGDAENEEDDITSVAAIHKSYGEALRRTHGAGAKLSPNDAVIVTKGDLAGVEGHVHSIKHNEKTFLMKVSREMVRELGISSVLEIPLDEATKNFEEGDHVKIIEGPHAGMTGNVTTVVRPGEEGKTPSATVHLDTGGDVVSVSTPNLQKTTEVANVSSSIGGYRIYDLVDLPPAAGGQRQSGVIVQISQSELKLLLPTGKTKSVTLQQIRGKANRRSEEQIVMDNQDRPIRVGDTVKITTGEHRGIDGTVKHIVKTFLFVHTYKRSENAGMIAVRASQALLSGVSGKHGAAALRNMITPQSATGNDRGPMNGSSAAGVESRKQGAVGEEWRGWSVKIRKGPHRGCIGMVKMVSGSQCKVELHSGQKQVKVNKKDLVRVGDRTGSREERAPVRSGIPQSEAAFAAPGATPAYGGATPAYGGATPAYGGATPAYGGATPAYGGATPAYGGATPAYGGATPAYGGATPAYGAATPTYQADA